MVGWQGRGRHSSWSLMRYSVHEDRSSWASISWRGTLCLTVAPFLPLWCLFLPGAMLGTSLLCLSFAGAAARAWQVCGNVTWQQEGPDLLQSTTLGFPRGPVYVSVKPVSPNRSLGPQTLPQDPPSTPHASMGLLHWAPFHVCPHTQSHLCIHTHRHCSPQTTTCLFDGSPPPPLALA